MSTNPFRGFLPYDEEHAGSFFGRTADIEKLVADIVSMRLVLLYAPSGSGKTSLIRAGVIPRLKQLGYANLCVRVHKNVENSLNATILNSDPKTIVDKSCTIDLKREFGRFCELVAKAKDDSATERSGQPLVDLLNRITLTVDRPVVLYFDQFEEFFMYSDPGPEDDVHRATRFADAVSRIYHDPTSRIHLVFSFRNDFLHHMDLFRDGIPRLFDSGSSLRLRNLSREKARIAVIRSLEDVGVAPDLPFIDRTVDDLVPKGRLEHDGGVPPARLSILWEMIFDLKLSLRDYEELGEVEGIIERRFRDELFDCLDKPAEQAPLLRKLLDALVTNDHSKRHQRRVCDKDEIIRALTAEWENLDPHVIWDRLKAKRIGCELEINNLIHIELVSDFLAERVPNVRGAITHSVELRAFDEAYRKAYSLDPIATQRIAENYRDLGHFLPGEAMFLFRNVVAQCPIYSGSIFSSLPQRHHEEAWKHVRTVLARLCGPIENLMDFSADFSRRLDLIRFIQSQSESPEADQLLKDFTNCIRQAEGFNKEENSELKKHFFRAFDPENPISDQSLRFLSTRLDALGELSEQDKLFLFASSIKTAPDCADAFLAWLQESSYPKSFEAVRSSLLNLQNASTADRKAWYRASELIKFIRRQVELGEETLARDARVILSEHADFVHKVEQRESEPKPKWELEVTKFLSSKRSTKDGAFLVHYTERFRCSENDGRQHGVRDNILILTYVAALDRLNATMHSLGRSLGTDARPIHVYIFDVESDPRLGYPVTALDPDLRPFIALPSSHDDPTSHAALQRAQMEAIHEATHVYNWSVRPPLPDPYLVAREWNWFNEATAVFMEHYCYKGSPEAMRFAANWVHHPEIPLNAETAQYEAGIFLLYLEARFDTKFIGRIWQESDPQETPIQALNRLLDVEATKHLSVAYSEHRCPIYGDFAFDGYFIQDPVVPLFLPEVFERYGFRAPSAIERLNLRRRKVRLAASEKKSPFQVRHLACRYFRFHLSEGVQSVTFTVDITELGDLARVEACIVNYDHSKGAMAIHESSSPFTRKLRIGKVEDIDHIVLMIANTGTVREKILECEISVWVD